MYTPKEHHVLLCLTGINVIVSSSTLPCFVHWCTVILEQKGTILKLFSQNKGSVEVSKMSWYAKAFTVPFIGIKGQAQLLKTAGNHNHPSTKRHTYSPSKYHVAM